MIYSVAGEQNAKIFRHRCESGEALLIVGAVAVQSPLLASKSECSREMVPFDRSKL